MLAACETLAGKECRKCRPHQIAIWCLLPLARMKIRDWSLRTLQVKLIKIGAKVIRHSRYVIFQMAEAMVSESLFHEILERISQLKPVPIGSG